jgi:phospholipase C
MLRRPSALPLVAALLMAGCTPSSSSQAAAGAIPPFSLSSANSVSGAHPNPIRHIIVIVQENRTVDNLFNGFPGADTSRVGKNSQGQTVTLHQISLAGPYDISHKHKAWVNDYDGGAMNGFDHEGVNCYARHQTRCPNRDIAAYGFVPENQVRPYWDMAKHYTFADELFQTNQGPSFPAHQYIVSGTSTINGDATIRASENPTNPRHVARQGGCDSQPHTTVETIRDDGSAGPLVYPCFTRRSIMNLMDASGVTWNYYQAFGGAGEWHAVDAVRPIWSRRQSYQNVIWPMQRVLKNIHNGTIAQVSFVTPDAARSDHAGRNNGSGPSWVASIVNEIGKSKYWKDTAIIVTWDDWGGWYDHVAPNVYNSYELGFRVPMIVISPYAKKGYVSHVHYEFGSILKFIEKTFSLGSLQTTDARSSDLTDCFNFGAAPSAFEPIAAPLSEQYFLQQPASGEPDSDD